MSHDDTARVVTTKYLVEVTACDGQFHVAVHVGIVGTAVELIHPSARHTSQDSNGITHDVGILSGVHHLLYKHVAFAAVTGIECHRSHDGAFRVTTAVGLMDIAARNQRGGVT